MTKAQRFKLELEGMGVEVEMGRHTMDSKEGPIKIFRAYLYMAGETGHGFDMRCQWDALDKAHKRLCHKLPQGNRPATALDKMTEGIRARSRG